ncbi:MAG: response regulator [Thiovulaceae bacterium]|nr:response regulator [Sulfurimonadaceae bacterium]
MSKDLDDILRALTILYIEDEQMIRESVTTTLKLLCKEVITAQDGEEGLKLYEKHKPQVIISDINMPKLSGLELVKIIREDDKSTPVILLSAHTDKEYLLEAVKMQLAEYLVKPVDFKMLHTALSACAKQILDSGSYQITFANQIIYHVIDKYLESSKKERIELTKTESALLDLLVANKTRLTSSDEIFNRLYDYDETNNPDSAIKALIYKLRSKIGKESLSNTSGLGYQLVLA